MIKLFILLLLFPFIGHAHPGIGIVKDTKGNVYYTDLKQVWKITKGNKAVVVPNVHTHELYINYDDKAVKFYHYLWVYRPTGKIDTVMGMKEAYVHQDFSFAKDKKRNEYYIKRFLVPHTDTNHIYRKSPDGKEIIFATGNFKNVNWLHPQNDGSLFYVSNNTIYKVDSLGNIHLVKVQVAHSNSLKKTFWNNILVWGVWQDNAKNIYAGVLSNQSVKKIDVFRNMTSIYKSEDNWVPLHGVFDNDDNLWILENSNKNDVRVMLAKATPFTSSKIKKTSTYLLPYIIISGVLLVIVIPYLKLRNINSVLRRLKS